MNLQTSAQTLLARSMNLQANFILRQAPNRGKPTVTTGAAQQPRVRTPAGTACVGIPAATGGDAKLRQSVATLRRDVEDFRKELKKAVEDGSLPSKQVDELVLKWSELDAQVDALLKLDTRRFDDKGYVLRAQDVGSFLNTTEAGMKGEISSKDLVASMPTRNDRFSFEPLSLPERLDGLPVEAARKLVDDAYAARAAQPAGASAPQGTKVLTDATFANFFAESDAGHAAKNDPTFEPKLLQHLQANTGQLDKASIRDILAGKTEAQATRLLNEAFKSTTVAALQDNAAAEALKVNKMVAALGVTPMKVPEDGHCLYHALAKSADPSKPVNDETAAAMRTEMLAGVRSSLAQRLRIAPENGELIPRLKTAAQVIDRIEAGLQPGAANSSAWGGPEEMQLYAMQKNRTVVFISTNGGYLHTPDQSTLPITDPTNFKKVLDKQAAEDLAAGREAPLIVINKTDTHFEAAVYTKPGASPRLDQQLASVGKFAKYSNIAQAALGDRPSFKLKSAEIALHDAQANLATAQENSRQIPQKQREVDDAQKRLLAKMRERTPGADMTAALQPVDVTAAWKKKESAQKADLANPTTQTKQAFEAAKKEHEFVAALKSAQDEFTGAKGRLDVIRPAVQKAQEALQKAKDAVKQAKELVPRGGGDSVNSPQLAAAEAELPAGLKASMKALADAMTACDEGVLGLRHTVVMAGQEGHVLEQFVQPYDADPQQKTSLTDLMQRLRRGFVTSPEMTGKDIASNLGKEFTAVSPEKRAVATNAVNKEIQNFKDQVIAYKNDLTAMQTKLKAVLDADSKKGYFSRMSGEARSGVVKLMAALAKLEAAAADPQGIVQTQLDVFDEIARRSGPGA